MEFRDIIKQIKNFGKPSDLYWSNALAGEVGEFCNLIKKFNRGDIKTDFDLSIFNTDISNELADIFIYLVLNARFHFIDLESAIIRKIKIIDKRILL